MMAPTWCDSCSRPETFCRCDGGAFAGIVAPPRRKRTADDELLAIRRLLINEGITPNPGETTEELVRNYIQRWRLKAILRDD